MRDLNRIRPFMRKLEDHWRNYIADWRFGQFMFNFFEFATEKTKRDIFYIEDDEMEKLLDEFFGINEA